MNAKLAWKWALGIAAIVVLTVVPALLHGSYSGRWGKPAEQSLAAGRIDEFPKELGDWVAVEEGEALSPAVQRELGLAGYIHRVYRHRESGGVARVMLMVGQPGPLVRHPPDICYASVNNRLMGEEQVKIDEGSGQASEFRVLRYDPSDQLTPTFEVAYAFSSDGSWQLPRVPRMAFGGEPVLYKVQVQVPLFASSPEAEEEIMSSLLDEFVKGFRSFYEAPG